MRTTWRLGAAHGCIRTANWVMGRRQPDRKRGEGALAAERATGRVGEACEAALEQVSKAVTGSTAPASISDSFYRVFCGDSTSVGLQAFAGRLGSKLETKQTP